MGKVKTFFYSYFKSLTSLSYYGDVIKAPFGFSFKIFLIWIWVVSFILAGYAYVKWVRPLGPFLEVLPSHVAGYYPQELVITIEDGVLSTNVAEPYIVPVAVAERFAEETRQLFEQSVKGTSTDDLENIVVIDTAASYEDFEDYQTAVLVTDTDVFYLDNHQVSAFSLDEVDNVLIDRELVEQGLGQMVPVMQKIVPFMGVGLLFGAILFYPAYKLVYLAFIALVFWLITQVTRYKLSYEKGYQIGLHLLMAVDSVFLVLAMQPFSVDLPLLRSLVMVILFGLVVRRLRETGK
jgi:hypothetical protein